MFRDYVLGSTETKRKKNKEKNYECYVLYGVLSNQRTLLFILSSPTKPMLHWGAP